MAELDTTMRSSVVMSGGVVVNVIELRPMVFFYVHSQNAMADIGDSLRQAKNQAREEEAQKNDLVAGVIGKRAPE